MRGASSSDPSRAAQAPPELLRTKRGGGGWLPSLFRRAQAKPPRKEITVPGIPFCESLHVAEGIASALAYAHGRGIVHRDVKPGNILLDADGNAQLTDFGLAGFRPGADREDSTVTAVGTLIGTPSYMSPEQCGSDRVTAKADVFSLGVTLFEMLAGRRPYPENTPYEVLVSQSVKQESPSLRAVVPAIPRALDDLVTTMLQAVSEERPDAAEVAKTLAMIRAQYCFLASPGRRAVVTAPRLHASGPFLRCRQWLPSPYQKANFVSRPP